MKAPRSGKDISKKWAEHILKEHKAANPPALLRVDTCTVREDKGDGFNSLVVFFIVETTEMEEPSSPEAKKVYHLVAKLISQEPHIKVMSKKSKTNLKEYLVYTDLISNMNKMLEAKAPEEPKISIPNLIYGKCTSKEFVLVMENLEYSGYKMNDKQKGLDGEHLKAAVDQLAKVHALSYVFHKSADMSKYSCFPSTLEHVNVVSAMIGGLFENSIKFLTSSKETEELGNKINLCKFVVLEKAFNAIFDDYTIKCLVHGDYWNNNIMFKYADASDEKRIIEEVKIIDWGNSAWGSPVYDLQLLVYTSTTRNIRKDHLDEVLHHYHQSFMRITSYLGSSPGNWSLEHLKTEWNKAYVAGFLLGCTYVQGTLNTTHPPNVKPEPSVLDRPMLFPLKFVVDGMMMGAASVIMPLTKLSSMKKIVSGCMSIVFKPVLEELKSGTNEVMNTRLLELFYEADENGLFST